MSKPLQEYVQQVLAEHDRGDKIRRAFEHANAKVNAMAAIATYRRKSTRRALFWEEAIDKLIELTHGDPGLQIVHHYDTVSFIFDDAVLVRLKKANLQLHSSNFPTQTAMMFHEHEADMFGFTGLQRVEAVYVPNRFDTGIIWSGVVAREGQTELWHQEFTMPVTAPAATLPHPVQPPADALAKVKNRAKGTEKKSEDGTAS